MATNYSNYYKVKSPSGYDIYDPKGQKLTYEQAQPLFQSGLNADTLQERPASNTLFSAPKTDYSQYSKTKTPTGYDLFGPSGYVNEEQGKQLFSGGFNADLVKEGTQQKQPEKPTEPTGDEFLSYYEGMSGKKAAETAKTEYDTARAKEGQLFDTATKTITGLYEQSDKLYRDLFQGADMTQFRDQASQAFKELTAIDAEEANETAALKQTIRERGTIGFAGNAQIRMVNEKYAGKRADAGAKAAIAQNNLDQAVKFADRSYEHSSNQLKQKIDLIDRELSRAKNLSEDERTEYAETLARAEKLYERRQSEKETANSLFLELSKAGVQGLSGGMSVEALVGKSGPQLAKLALEKIAAEKKQQAAELAATNALTAQRTKETETTPDSDYKNIRDVRTVSAIDEALPMINNLTAGFAGSLSSGIAGTPAYNLAKALDSIKANIGFNELQAMREASKTGGALGQVAVQELNFLQSVLGSLDQGQSPAQLKENLGKIKASVQRWKDASVGTDNSSNDPLGLFK